MLRISFSNVGDTVDYIERERAISLIEVLANMPELSCGSGEVMCVDLDKVRVMSSNSSLVYEDFWPVASIEVLKVKGGKEKGIVECPATDCNYYSVYSSEKTEFKKYSSFVSLCERVREKNKVIDRCEVAQLIVGMNLR